MGDAEFQRGRSGVGDQSRGLIARTRPNQFDGQYGIFGLGEVLYGPFFDLAPRKEPWPAAIMSEYGKLATAAAAPAGMSTSTSSTTTP